MIGESLVLSTLFWQVHSASFEIPVMRPCLPSSDRLLPYLRLIDDSRVYSNGGSLTRAFEERLRTHFNVEAVTLCANATIGLALAIVAQSPPIGSLCMVPSWTFAASAHAIYLAGLVPWIVDVNAESQQLTADMARDFLREAPGQVGAVMPVMPFGAPADMLSWDVFRDETGLAVVIDAAAAFDTVRPAETPCVVSLHATKVLGIGEGAFIACSDHHLIERIVQRGNFGFHNTRESIVPAVNAKLSEYSAAVGLAGLDLWQSSRDGYLNVAKEYRRQLDRSVHMAPGQGEAWATSTVVVRLTHSERGLVPVIEGLHADGIGTRCWWGGGLHRHAAFTECPRTDLTVTDTLAGSSLGLPCWPDLSALKIERICASLKRLTVPVA